MPLCVIPAKPAVHLNGGRNPSSFASGPKMMTA